MSIGPIGPRPPRAPGIDIDLAGSRAEGSRDPSGAGAAADSFGSILKDAVTQLDALQKQADSNVARLAMGEPVDLHDVTIGLEQASLGFQLVTQVRNKLVEAYQEIARMQV